MKCGLELRQDSLKERRIEMKICRFASNSKPGIPRCREGWAAGLNCYSGNTWCKHYKPKDYKVLLTGGAGYIGSVVRQHFLDNGYAIRVIDNSPCDYSGDINISIDTQRAIQDMDCVVHLAAIVGEKACDANPRKAINTNYRASIGLIDLLLGSQVKFIFASTCSNYGIKKEPASEDSELLPLSLYASSKVYVEKYLENNAGGLDYTILRLSTAYGLSPKMRFDLTVNEFALEAIKKRKLIVYEHESCRPYVHVADIARAIELVIERPNASYRQIFNVGGENLTKDEIATKIKGSVPECEITYDDRITDRRDYRVSFDKIATMLDYTPTKTVDEGILEIIKGDK